MIILKIPIWIVIIASICYIIILIYFIISDLIKKLIQKVELIERKNENDK